MARYIDADKLKEMIEAKADTLIEGKEAFLYVAKWLDLLPTVDAAPKKEITLEVIRKVKNKVRKYKHNVVNPYEHIILYLNELEKKYTEDKDEQAPTRDPI